MRKAINLFLLAFLLNFASCSFPQQTIQEQEIVSLTLNLNSLHTMPPQQISNMDEKEPVFEWKPGTSITDNLEKLIQIGNPAVSYLIIALHDQRLVGIWMPNGVYYPHVQPINYGVAQYELKVSDLAAYALKRITKEDFIFCSEDTLAERTEIINKWYQWWINSSK